jgi:hypothetical protein
VTITNSAIARKHHRQNEPYKAEMTTVQPSNKSRHVDPRTTTEGTAPSLVGGNTQIFRTEIGHYLFRPRSCLPTSSAGHLMLRPAVLLLVTRIHSCSSFRSFVPVQCSRSNHAIRFADIRTMQQRNVIAYQIGRIAKSNNRISSLRLALVFTPLIFLLLIGSDARSFRPSTVFSTPYI